LKGDERRRLSKRLRRIFLDALEADKSRKLYLEKAGRQPDGPWMKGYLMAMNAVLSSQTLKKHALKLDLESEAEDLRFFRKRFRDISNDAVLRDFDKGYFKAWKDYVDYLFRKKKSRLVEGTGSG
jgi:hypothetical protein